MYVLQKCINERVHLTVVAAVKRKNKIQMYANVALSAIPV